MGTDTRKMNVTLIGAGNLATQMGQALYDAGHNIVQVFSRTMTSAEQLAAHLHSQATDSLSQLSSDSDVYIIAVKDSVLDEVAAQACMGREDKVFLHTAGSMPLRLFEGKARHFGVFYPMQTFSKARAVDFTQIPVFLEASDADTLLVAQQMAYSISHKVYELSTEGRRYLHLAAVFACNFANHCYTLAERVLAPHGIAFDTMLPLIEETTHKLYEMSPADAQTGPAVRYDQNVMQRQMLLLDDDTMARRIYELMSDSIHQTALERQDK